VPSRLRYCSCPCPIRNAAGKFRGFAVGLEQAKRTGNKEDPERAKTYMLQCKTKLSQMYEECVFLFANESGWTSQLGMEQPVAEQGRTPLLFVPIGLCHVRQPMDVGSRFPKKNGGPAGPTIDGTRFHLILASVAFGITYQYKQRLKSSTWTKEISTTTGTWPKAT